MDDVRTDILQVAIATVSAAPLVASSYRGPAPAKLVCEPWQCWQKSLVLLDNPRTKSHAAHGYMREWGELAASRVLRALVNAGRAEPYLT